MVGIFKQHKDLFFDEATHRYTYKGVPIKSVTQKLSEVAVSINGEWRPVCDNRFSVNPTAAQFGKAFHKLCAFNLLGLEFDVPEVMESWYSQFLKFRKAHSFLHPIKDEAGIPLVEYPMAHSLMRYCGTPDVIFEADKTAPLQFRNKIVVCDWKTSVTEMDYWAAQTSAYAELFKNQFKDLIKNRRILTMSVRFEENTYHPHTQIMEIGWPVFNSVNTLTTRRH